VSTTSRDAIAVSALLVALLVGGFAMAGLIEAGVRSRRRPC
jgi:hypothetical protein